MEFNLTREPWLPIGRTQLSLRDAFSQALHLPSLSAETPCITFSLVRLLSVIAQRAYGIHTRADWLRLWESGHFDDQVQEYLKAWAPRFDLFDQQHPFYQDPYVPNRNASPINILCLHMSSGNNSTLVSQNLNDTTRITPAEAARNLVTVQAFGTCGLSGHSATGNFIASPLTFKSIVQVRGINLFETILLNMIPGEYFPTDTESEVPDIPAWEQENFFRIQRATPLGIFDLLTWLSRCIQLLPAQDGSGMVDEMIWVRPRFDLSKEIRDPFEIAGLRCSQGYRYSFKILARLINPESRPTSLVFLEDLSSSGLLRAVTLKILVGGLDGDRARIDGQVIVSTAYPLSTAGKERASAGLEILESVAEIARSQAWSQAMSLSQGDGKAAGSLANSWGMKDRFYGAIHADWMMYLTGAIDEPQLQKAASEVGLRVVNSARTGGGIPADLWEIKLGQNTTRAD